MCKKLMFLVCFVVLGGMVSVASAADIKVDWGNQGTLDSSWTEWSSTSGSKSVDGVQLTLSNSGLNNGAKLRPWRSGAGDKLVVDCLSAEDFPSGGNYTLTITNLPAGEYEMLNYSNESESHPRGSLTVTVDAGHGGDSATASTTDNAAAYTDLTEGTGLATVTFSSSGPADTITITYTWTTGPFINGFELVSQGPRIQFGLAASGDLETVSPVVLEVVLSNGEEGQTYTVDYAVTGGTATRDIDYTLADGTLTFNPGETSKTIEIDIVDDDPGEGSETIIVELSNPTGPNVVLGAITEHTYTILESLPPSVEFETTSSSALESASPAVLEVVLSNGEEGQTYTVDYAVTGGTATRDIDYTLADGTLTFSPGEASKTIEIDIVDDGLSEDDETIIVELSNPTGAYVELGAMTEHTYTILESLPPVEGEAVDLKIDIGSCGDGGDGTCEPGDERYQVVKEGWTEWTESDVDLPGGEACADWYERKTKTVGNIQMELLRVGQCSDQYGQGLRFKNAGPGPLAGDGVRVNNLPNDDDPNPCGGDPKLRLTITGLPQVTSYNYTMTSWHNELGDACYSPTVNISVNGSQVVSSLPITRNEPDESAVNATYEVPGGAGTVVIEFTGAANKGNITLNGFYLTDGAGATDPIPADGAVNVQPDVELGWTPGQYALSHNVYLGTSKAAVTGAIEGSPEFKGNIGANSFGVSDLDLGRTYYWRIDEVNGAYPESPWRGKVWSFTTAGAKARDPNPADDESDVHPIPTLSWTPAPPAESHDVYLGTDETAVANATEFSTEFQANVDVNNFEPGLLDFGRTYYWRIDEVNDAEPASPWIGDVWQFTVHDGSASNPDPPDGSKTPTPYVVLSWTAAPLAGSHNVYFGTSETAVASATTGSSEYKGNQVSTSYDPRPLSEDVTYYWRVDEVGSTVTKGEVWSFTGVAPVDLKVDLALESPWNSGIPLAATLKPGWTPFTGAGWGDLYMHDWRGIPNLGGTGIDVSMTSAREGTNGLKCYDMCMCGKGGGCEPNGDPVGDPIANTWYTSVDRVSSPQANVLLALYNLPSGTYELIGYHNLWEPQSSSQRECTRNGYGHLAMPQVHVWSFADANDWGKTVDPTYQGQFYDAFGKIRGFGAPAYPDPPYSRNIVAIEEDYDVMPSSTTNDDEVTQSVVKFWTDGGSPVMIMYESGDCLTSQYTGCRGVLNAFEVRSVPTVEQPPACWGYLSQCHGDTDNSGDVKGSDFLALKASWYKCAPDPDYNPCADFDRNGCVKGSDFLILKSNWYKPVPADCPPGGTWPPQP